MHNKRCDYTLWELLRWLVFALQVYIRSITRAKIGYTIKKRPFRNCMLSYNERLEEIMLGTARDVQRAST